MREVGDLDHLLLADRFDRAEDVHQPRLHRRGRLGVRDDLTHVEKAIGPQLRGSGEGADPGREARDGRQPASASRRRGDHSSRTMPMTWTS